MGFLDRFRKKKKNKNSQKSSPSVEGNDFAEMFVRSYEEYQGSQKQSDKLELMLKMSKMMRDWYGHFPNDSNRLLANILLSKANNIPLDCNENYNLATESFEPVNSELYSWFKSNAEEVMDDNEVEINDESSNRNLFDFQYLDDLIHNGDKEIKLTGDIEFSADDSNQINIDIDDLTIDGDGHIIDSKGNSSIFLISGKNVQLKNLTFKNACDDLKGGAILVLDTGSVSIKDCKFLDNQSKYGGAISNYGDINLENVVFKGNHAQKGGGAIFNNTGSLVATNVKFHNNTAYLGGAIGNYSKIKMEGSLFKANHADFEGGAIYNNPGSALNIVKTDFTENTANKSIIHNMSDDSVFIDCNFFKNTNDYGIIDNNAALKFINCKFDFNKSKFLINAFGDSDLSISGCKFTNNDSKLTAIYNNGKDCNISNATFKDNNSELPFAQNILNDTALGLHALKLEDDVKSITNNGELKLRKFSIEDAKRFIHNQGNIEYFDIPGDNPFNFVYLEDLIHENADDTVYLNSDIILDNYEVDFYEGGIELNMGDLVIDGNHHVIDANNNSRIFLISAGKVTLRNIIFRNGNLINKFSEHTTGGGAIRILSEGSLTLENCQFIDNHSDDDGGAILNNGILTCGDSKFENNHSHYYGGAIYNRKEFSTSNDEYLANNSEMAGAVYNIGSMNIDGISVSDNSSNLTQPIFSSNLVNAQNISYDIGDLIYNTGDINQKENSIETFTYLKNRIANSNFIDLKQDIIFDYDVDNELKQGILIDKKDEMLINGNDFSIDAMNTSSLFKVINDTKITFKNIVFKAAFSDSVPIIENDVELVFEDCKFVNNKSSNDSSLIKNNHSLKLVNCSFSNNRSTDTSLIDNHGELVVLNCDFISNESNCDGGVMSNSQSATISQSNFNGNSSKSNGGVIYNHVESTLDISNTTFANNHAGVEGGSIINAGNLNVLDCHFEQNTSGNTSGAIYNVKSLEVEKSKFIKNQATFGGAIANMGEITLRDVQFSENYSESDGGALNNQGHIIIFNSGFENNNANNYGGAISNIATIEIKDSTFNNNSSVRDGGVINCSTPRSFLTVNNSTFNNNNSNFGGVISNFGRVFLFECRFEDNRSTERGGVLITAKNSNVSIENNEFIGNSSMYGGAILSSGFIKLTDSRFINNSANAVGGAIYINEGGSIEGSNNEFMDNSNNQEGGAIINCGELDFKDTSFKNNRAKVGGAIYNNPNSYLNLHNVKFSNNNASKTGGAIFTYGHYEFNLDGCEFDGNLPEDVKNMSEGSSQTGGPKRKIKKMTDDDLARISSDFADEGIDSDENALKEIIRNDSDIHRQTVALICLVNMNEIYNEAMLLKYCGELKEELRMNDDDFDIIIETLNNFG